MAFVAAGESEARKRALLQNQQLENAATNIMAGIKGFGDQAEARKKALLESEIKTQERIDKANAEEAKNVAEWNKNERELEFKQEQAEKDRLFKEEQAKKDRELKGEIAKLSVQGRGKLTPYQEKSLALKEKSTEKTAQPAQNEFQAATFAERTKQAEDVFNTPAYTDAATSRYEQIKGMLPGEFGSENKLLADQAERNFVNSVLRRESGAAIAPSEFKSAERQYFPRPGDTPAVIQQKAANRQAVIQGLQREGGRVLSKAQGAQPAKLTPEQRQALINSLRGQ